MTHRLELVNVGRRFGGLQAVADVSFTVGRGEVFGIIGPNGAGKTTLFNLIAGIFHPSAGRVIFDGDDITGRTSDAIARLGIARTFQGIHAFRDASVRENLRRSALLARSHDPVRHMRNAWRRDRRITPATCDAMAQFVGLSEFADTPAGALSYGSKKVLGIGMALMESPKVLLMDEPAAGLNPTEKQRIGEIIHRIRDEQHIDVLIVEHDMRLIMSTCDRILVLNQGRMIAVGTPDAVRTDPAVVDAYLGVEYEFA
ncbi:MAG: ABC transporter ATP-binding protein [Burkholderiales bacterium]|nr:ABC transporter ATP-binding protein [Burkholderiales bacterium]